MAQESAFDLFCTDDSFLSDPFHEDEDDDLLCSDDIFLSDPFDEDEDDDLLCSDDIFLSAPFHEDEDDDLLCSDDPFLSALFDEDEDDDLLCSDDPFLSALLHEDEDDDHAPFTDAECEQRLQFQETLHSSLITSQKPKNDLLSSSWPPSSSSSTSLLLLPSSSSPSAPLKMADKCPTQETEHVKCSNETGESSQVICEICVETRENSRMFRNQICHHSFCSDCVTKQVATKIQDSITVVSCPALDCKSVLEIDACRPWLPKDLLDRWERALCEALFLAAPKFYCPFKDCSAMLLVENEEYHQAIRKAECPHCHRLFCAKCDVPWHPGVECEEFQKLNENERERQDLIVRELAKEKKWQRCPNCRFIVEKTEGCLHITCRCHFEFCYGCGEQWTSTHGGCQTN